MGQYDDVERMLENARFQDVVKHGYDHHNTVNRIDIYLKTRNYVIPMFRLVVKHTIEDAPVCDVASRVAEAMVDELTVYAAIN